MSFQDVGRTGKSRRPISSNARSVQYRQNAIPPSSADNMKTLNDPNTSYSDNSQGMFSQASDSILQYQKNVGLLENMNRQVGTSADGPVLETQFKVQVGVIYELGSKIQKHMRALEINLSSMSRTEASRSRATYMKLTRDFQTVETKFKKLKLDAIRKRNFIEAQRRDKEDDDRRRNEQDEFNQESMKLQLQMQENRLAEEIMREREDEIRNINKGMNQVNEIYKVSNYF